MSNRESSLVWKNLRIIMVSSFDHSKCGVRRYSENLINELTRLWVHVVKVPTFKHYGFKAPILLFNTIRYFSRKYDVRLIHIQHEYGIYALPKGASIAFVLPLLRLLGLKIVVTLHTTYEPSLLIKSYLRETRRLLEFSKTKAIMYLLSIPIRLIIHVLITFIITNLAHKVIIHTPRNMKGTYTKYSKVKIIPHGTPTPRYANIGTLCTSHESEILELRNRFRDKKIIITPGFIRPSKRYDWVIEAVASKELSEKVMYIIAGSPQTEAGKRWLDIIKNLAKATQNVIIMEKYLNECELALLLLQADMIVLPYYTASLTGSGVLHDAMAYCKPIIAPKHGEFELYEDAIVFFDIQNPVESIKNAILRLMDENVYRDLQIKLCKYVNITRFDIVAKLHKNIYIETLCR